MKAAALEAPGGPDSELWICSNTLDTHPRSRGGAFSEQRPPKPTSQAAGNWTRRNSQSASTGRYNVVAVKLTDKNRPAFAPLPLD